MSGTIRKAVIPVGGLGTRLLPATKAVPKELLTVVDRPAIQFIVDEAREAGIEHFIFVTGRGKSAIEDYFDTNFELETQLRDQGKHLLLKQLSASSLGPGRASFTRQHAPLGLGHAIGCARHIVGDEPFAVLLPDMIMRSNPGCLAELVEVHAKRGGNVIALEDAAGRDVSRYGVAGFRTLPGGAVKIEKLVEKPAPGQAPSNHIISGRYILQPRIFDLIAAARPGSGGEIQLTDAMAGLLEEQAFWGFKFEGATFDCGDKLGLLLANAAYGMADETVGGDFRDALKVMMAGDRSPRRKLAPALPLEQIAV